MRPTAAKLVLFPYPWGYNESAMLMRFDTPHYIQVNKAIWSIPVARFVAMCK